MNSVNFDIKECSSYLNISVSLIRKLIRNKEMPYTRIGVKLLFSKNEIDNWLKNKQIKCKD